ncbi:ArsR family transcriptional regulator [Bradyrhizobium diazoefficiens]|uniref:HVO_A0114 family putative DNA-binding protein n=1 Tax=Bradyrhizobium diazoefficiens TaxID=1355477 RepID=UPI00190C5A82|nr:ArsR family transcriptional regulator [Bradyrhizobium diazoefficiens]QQO33226.1 ArsR family transcriptional regulator [Bradyrhizobium diazoefficiens]
MSKLISGQTLRDRLLDRVSRPPAVPSDAWVQVLAAPGNRELLGLIAQHQPKSISELSELAGRAQPNVSRSLTALIQASLVEVTSQGRASVPTLTALGREKARDFGLLEHVAEPAMVASDHVIGPDAPHLSISFAGRATDNSDVSPGDLVLTLPPRADHEPIVAKQSGDINGIVLRILDHWWRILYRRDAPYRIGEFSAVHAPSTRQVSLAIRSVGDRVEHVVRWADDVSSRQEQFLQIVSLDAFKQNLLDDVLRPAVSEMRSRGRYDRPIQSKLARLEDTLSYEQDSVFARTAGSLGESPYNLTSEWAQKVRDLISEVPDEESRLDFCSAVLKDGIDEAEAWTRSEITKQGDRNAMPELRVLSEELRETPAESRARAYQRGISMAKKLRKHLKLTPETGIANTVKLAAMFGAGGFETSPAAPCALRAFQSQTRNAPTIVVEKETAADTKFILARAIGDFLVFRSKTSCVANLYTDRQAVGRAFAAEFIAPAESVVRMIEEDDQSVERVAEHYGAPAHVIQHQYGNNFRRFIEA